MGFVEHFINMIWILVSNNWYSVFVNGQSSGYFKSSRGVKQGDPLSATLFILSAKVLSRSLNKLFDDKSFVGFGMPKWNDPLNYLAYADDTIKFASTHTESLKKIMAVLNDYEKISGQLINKAKSSYYMHSKATNALRRKDYYDDLINNVKAKLHSWKGKLSSFGGKATFISSVLQSLGALYHLVPPDFYINVDLLEMVELRQEDIWNVELIDQSFPEDIAEPIKLQVQFEGSDGLWDRPWWKPTSSGRFTMRSA
nr:uncharacterized protein LOC108945797 [Nicotiana tomentosiformis]